jgi:hypothetical protein
MSPLWSWGGPHPLPLSKGEGRKNRIFSSIVIPTEEVSGFTSESSRKRDVSFVDMIAG